MTSIAGCAACGADIRADARFCWRCGTAIQRAANGTAGAPGRCPACGHANSAGATVCSACTRQLFEAARAAAENSAKATTATKSSAPARIVATSHKQMVPKPAAARADATPFRNSRPGAGEGLARPPVAPVDPPAPTPVEHAQSEDGRQNYFRWAVSALAVLLAVAGAFWFHDEGASSRDAVATKPTLTSPEPAARSTLPPDGRAAVLNTSAVQAEQTGEAAHRLARGPEPTAAASPPAEIKTAAPAQAGAAPTVLTPAPDSGAETAAGQPLARPPSPATSTQRKRPAEPNPPVSPPAPEPVAAEPAPVRPAAVEPPVVAAAPAPVAVPQDPCATAHGLAQQQCRACSGLGQPRRFFCEEGVRLRYCSGRWGSTSECPHAPQPERDSGG